MTAVTTAALMAAGWPVLGACAAGLACAASIGLFNGLCVTKLRMPPFVPTLATMSIARALALVITPFFSLGGGTLFGLPNPFLIFVGLSVLGWFVLDRTIFGRQLYAIGGNERAARLSGIEVDRLKIGVYTASAVMAGIAGIIEVSYLSSAIANQGLGRVAQGRHLRRHHRRACCGQSQRSHQGFRSGIGGGFTEVAGTPFPCDDDSNKAIQLIQDILTKNPTLDGIFYSGGWPMFAPEAPHNG
jgi:hypothetical protein